MGSVKDLILLNQAYENQLGLGNFDFSDRYSIFDWGEMPDHIKNKGAALAVMAAFNFEELEMKGIRTHYKGLVRGGELIRFSDLKEGSEGANIMYVEMAVRYDPIARKFMGKRRQPRIEYDYSFFENNRGRLNNYLIGLEIIFRNGLPKGSSVFDKLKEAEGDEEATKAVLDKLGLRDIPKEGDRLPKPIMNYTTKLEAGDRNLTEEEAYKISGLGQEDFVKVAPLALRVNDIITERAQRAGMVHYDGKIEMVYNKGLVICDAVGTFDENRFCFNEEQVSKEFLRQWYEKNQPEFKQACKQGKETGRGWQERCPVKPVKLPEELSTLVSQMYMAGCNQYTGKRIFKALELGEAMDRIRLYR